MNLDVLISVDPSLTSTGIAIFKAGVLDNVHNIRTKKPKDKGTPDNRLIDIAAAFKHLLAIYKPSSLCIETQFFGGLKGNSMIKVIEVKGLLEGIFLSDCFQRGIKPFIQNITPAESKSAIGVKGGLKHAESKQAVKDMVCQYYPHLATYKQDIMDAVAIGICCCVKYNVSTIKK